MDVRSRSGDRKLLRGDPRPLTSNDDHRPSLSIKPCPSPHQPQALPLQHPTPFFFVGSLPNSPSVPSKASPQVSPSPATTPLQGDLLCGHGTHELYRIVGLVDESNLYEWEIMIIGYVSPAVLTAYVAQSSRTSRPSDTL